MAKIGVLILHKKTDRGKSKTKSFDDLLYLGLKIILEDLKQEYEYISFVNIKDYDFVLVSLTSVMDVENIICTLGKADKGKCKIIVGGSGCINIRSYIGYIDIAVFGRADNQINEIIDGAEFDNVWRKDKDPELKGSYIIRQVNKLNEKENTIGCPRKCYFCQYTWTRKMIGERYHHGIDLKVDEDDFQKLEIKRSGRYTTAFDGLSASSRIAVNKTWCSVEEIKNKINGIYNNQKIIKPVNIKLFQIVGFPWESEQTFITDLKENKSYWRRVDRKNKKKRIIFMYVFTPFSPEPLTPMQYSRANIIDNWREYLGGAKCHNIYGDKTTDIEAFTLPQIPGGFTLAKRVLINRCTKELKEKIVKILEYPKQKSVYVMVKNVIQYIGMDIFNKIDPQEAGFNYLKTYCNVNKLDGKAESKYKELSSAKKPSISS